MMNIKSLKRNFSILVFFSIFPAVYITFNFLSTNPTKNQLVYLSEKIQAGIHNLQNPVDCAESRRLIIYNEAAARCGFGCAIHQIARLLNLAYVTNRTLLVIQSNNLALFKNHVSENCLNWKNFKYENTANTLEEILANDQIFYVNSWEINSFVKKFTANWIELESAKYSHVHSQPEAWLYSQFVYYLTQFNGEFAKKANQFLIEKQFDPGCVGLHIRRTDKIQEAEYHGIEEYMKEVDKYFDSKGMFRMPLEKCVVLMSDEPALIKEAKEKYSSKYRLIFNEDHALGHKKVEVTEQMENFYLDFYLLSQCDFVICTLTSNLCRLIYEHFSLRFYDVSKRLVSLDIDYRLLKANGPAAYL